MDNARYLDTIVRIAQRKVRALYSTTDDNDDVTQLDDDGDIYDDLAIGKDLEVAVRLGGRYYETTVGAAELILDDRYMNDEPCIVLEGAPGQGKSTLSQYLAQVQRARLLERVDDLTIFNSGGYRAWSSWARCGMPES